MTLQLRLEWQAKPPTVQVYALGDVRAVLNSNASSTLPLPDAMTHGLGALSRSDPAGAGEGIVVRGWTGITPPQPHAGTHFTYQPGVAHVATPFCLGWHGEAFAQGSFSSSGVTVRELYESLLEQATQRAGAPAAAVFVEVVGLFAANHIHDRALILPVATGNVLITSEEYAGRYFGAGIIQQDLAAHGYDPQHQVALVLVGVGFNPLLAPPDLKQLDDAVFYAAPRLGAIPDPTAATIKTHTHALGWRNQARLVQQLAQLDQDSAGLAGEIAADLLQSAPDYVVHLDEWSMLTHGLVRLYIVDDPAHVQHVSIG